MVKSLYKKNCIILLMFCTLIGSLCGCRASDKEPISKTGFYFDTVIQISIYGQRDDTLINQCFSYCEEFEQKFSRTIETSEISRLNAAGGKKVQLSEDTIVLLQKGIEYGRMTDGMFDITIAPLTELWDIKNAKEPPREEDIKEALSHVGYEKLIIEGNEACLTDAKAAVDLGGIAKGYMADKLKEFLCEHGVTRGMINLGGNVLTIGKKENEAAWNIGIRKPFGENQEVLTSVSVTDASVVTSGSYERYFVAEDGTLYHHILNPKTGYPCKNQLNSVTILSPNSVDGDALSTACFLMGTENGMELIESLEDTEALFVTDENQILDTRK